MKGLKLVTSEEEVGVRDAVVREAGGGHEIKEDEQ